MPPEERLMERMKRTFTRLKAHIGGKRFSRAMSANGEVPLDCAACGFFLGTGFPGGTAYCSRCQNLVLTKARTGNLGAAIGALALVVIAFGVGAAIVKALSD